MTDYSKMTDEQVNEAIFMAKGYVKNNYGFWVKHEHTEALSSVSFGDLPDYTHDWRLAGELLEEMKASLCFDDDTRLWECEYFTHYGEDEVHLFVMATTPQRAICEAWLAWKEQE